MALVSICIHFVLISSWDWVQSTGALEAAEDPGTGDCPRRTHCLHSFSKELDIRATSCPTRTSVSTDTHWADFTWFTRTVSQAAHWAIRTISYWLRFTSHFGQLNHLTSPITHTHTHIIIIQVISIWSMNLYNKIILVVVLTCIFIRWCQHKNQNGTGQSGCCPDCIFQPKNKYIVSIAMRLDVASLIFT